MTTFRFPAFNIPPPERAANLEPSPLSGKRIQYLEDIAVVEKEIRPSYKGRVRYRGVSWLAQCEENIVFYPQDRVLVVGRYHITLIVEPLPVADSR